MKGDRFVYCAVCDLPVAKRNFATRHSHTDFEPTAFEEKGGGDSSSVDAAGEAAEPDEGSSL
jgi:hypothetical protein